MTEQMTADHTDRRPGRWRRRMLVAAGAFVLLVILLAAAGWFLWLPNWRPSLHPGERYGIDVSAHQGDIDWSAVARDSVTFAYVKATEGGDFDDARFAQNWAGANAAGIDHGAYHFFTLCTAGQVQAAHFLAVAPPNPGAMAPAVDLELAGNCHARPDRAAVVRQLDDFMSAVESAWGRRLVAYIGDDFEDRYHVRDSLRRALWIRRIIRRPDDGSWLIWQVSGYAHVAGIAGRVDLDVLHG